jgi:metal-responsive CopG/Arc/MetJ family transcriptional regulator
VSTEFDRRIRIAAAKLDTDRSKFIRDALEMKLAQVSREVDQHDQKVAVCAVQ